MRIVICLLSIGLLDSVIFLRDSFPLYMALTIKFQGKTFRERNIFSNFYFVKIQMGGVLSDEV